MRMKDKLGAIGAFGGIVIIFLSISLPPPWETASEVYRRLLYMGVPWFFFIFVIAPKLVLREEPPNLRSSGEPISREKLLIVIEGLTEMGLMRRSTKDPVVLALLKRTEQKLFRITRMTHSGEITLQQSLDEEFKIINESRALISMLKEPGLITNG